MHILSGHRCLISERNTKMEQRCGILSLSIVIGSWLPLRGRCQEVEGSRLKTGGWPRLNFTESHAEWSGRHHAAELFYMTGISRRGISVTAWIHAEWCSRLSYMGWNGLYLMYLHLNTLTLSNSYLIRTNEPRYDPTKHVASSVIGTVALITPVSRSSTQPAYMGIHSHRAPHEGSTPVKTPRLIFFSCGKWLLID